MLSRVTKKLAKKWVYTRSHLKHNDRGNLRKPISYKKKFINTSDVYNNAK